MERVAPTPIAAFRLAWIRDRDVLLAFIAGLVIAVCWRSPLMRHGELWAFLLRDRSGISAAELLAIATLIWLALRFRSDALLSRSDLVAIGATVLAFALPVRLAAIVPLTVVGLKLVFHRDARAASAGQILLVLAFYEWFGPIIFHLLSPLALKVEALMVFAVLAPFGGFAYDGVSITGGAGGHHIEIEEGCSAFHNLSLSTLLWISLVKLDTLTMRPIHYCVAAAMAVATVALNTVRMALMAQSSAMQEYWHDGAGVPIVAVTMLAATLAICLGGLRYSEAR
jgi:hypothetical protein